MNGRVKLAATIARPRPRGVAFAQIYGEAGTFPLTFILSPARGGEEGMDSGVGMRCVLYLGGQGMRKIAFPAPGFPAASRTRMTTVYSPGSRSVRRIRNFSVRESITPSSE